MEVVKFEVQLGQLFDHKPRKNQIVGYFPHVDFRCGHFGLSQIAKKDKVDVLKLKIGEFVVFINNEQSAIKVYTAGNIVVHQKALNGRINPRIISLIPKYFSGRGFDMKGATTEAIKADMAPKK